MVSSITVLHTNHWTEGNTGRYFYFNETKFDEIVGRTNWSAESFEVVQSGSQEWNGTVVVWKGDSHSAAHGRRTDGSAANQWQTGDIIVLLLRKE